MSDRPPVPPLAKAVFAVCILANLIVFTGLSRSGPALLVMLMANISACGALYWVALRHLFRRLPPPPGDQSPSRKSSPISE